MQRKPLKVNRPLTKHFHKILKYSGAHYIFTLPLFLNASLSDEAIEKKSALTNLSGNVSLIKGHFQGYKLAIVTSLYNFLDEVVRNPIILGIKPDDELYNYWVYTKLQGRNKLENGPKRGNDLPGIINKINELVSHLLGIQDWDGLKQFYRDLEPVCNTLINIRDVHYVLRDKAGKDLHITCKNYIEENAAIIIWTKLLNSKHANHIYTDLYRNHLKTLDEESVFEEDYKSTELTRLDGDENIDPIPWKIPIEWAEGYAQAITQAMVIFSPKEIGERIQKIYNARSPINSWSNIDDYELELDTVFGLPPIIPSESFLRIGRITKAERAYLVGTEKPIEDEVEFIRSRMGNRARIVENDYSTAHLRFECLLKGAIICARHYQEKALVACVRHPSHRNVHDYSFAILMPATGFFYNSSIWWVFFDVADDDKHDSEGIFCLQKIYQILKNHSKNIDIIKFTALKDKFYKYCEDPGYIRLKRQNEFLKERDSHIRGTYPELLLVAYLGRKSAHPIYLSYKRKFLGKQLDVIACLHKKGTISEVVIFESKGRATDDKELEEELDKFNTRIQLVRTNWDEVAKELEISACPIPKFTTIFVSMRLIEPSLSINIPKGIQLWDLNIFLDKLRKSGISNEYLDIIPEKILALRVDTLI